jgi:hypothetical protein
MPVPDLKKAGDSFEACVTCAERRAARRATGGCSSRTSGFSTVARSERVGWALLVTVGFGCGGVGGVSEVPAETGKGTSASATATTTARGSARLARDNLNITDSSF